MIKKKILSILTFAIIFGMPILANAAENAANGPYVKRLMNTNTVIEANLYLVNGTKFVAEGYTKNISQNGKNPYVQVYATKEGDVIPNTTTTRKGYWINNVGWSDKATARSTSTIATPDYWGGAHSTNNTPDPYFNLYLRVQ